MPNTRRAKQSPDLSYSLGGFTLYSVAQQGLVPGWMIPVGALLFVFGLIGMIIKIYRDSRAANDKAPVSEKTSKMPETIHVPERERAPVVEQSALNEYLKSDDADVELLLNATDGTVINLNVGQITVQHERTKNRAGDLSQALEINLAEQIESLEDDLYAQPEMSAVEKDLKRSALARDHKYIRRSFAAELHRNLVGGNSRDQFAGSLAALYADAKATGDLEIVTRFITSYDDMTNAVAALSWAKQPKGQKNVRHVFVVRTMAQRTSMMSNGGMLEALMSRRAVILFEHEARTLAQLKASLTEARSVVEGMTLKNEDLVHAQFRFLVPQTMDLAGFIGDETLDPVKYRFFLMINNALNTMLLEVPQGKLENLPKIYRQSAIAA
jgi:hypothetical protein